MYLPVNCVPVIYQDEWLGSKIKLEYTIDVFNIKVTKLYLHDIPLKPLMDNCTTTEIFISRWYLIHIILVIRISITKTLIVDASA